MQQTVTLLTCLQRNMQLYLGGSMATNEDIGIAIMMVVSHIGMMYVTH